MTEPQALPPTDIESLRNELDRTRNELAKYVGHEPTVAEEMQYLSEENERLRKIAAFLLLEYAEKSTVDLWDDDLDTMTGPLDIEPSPDRKETTRVTYTRGPVRPPKRTRKPINHRAEAEKHASQAAHLKSDRRHHPIDPIATDFHLRMATVHATLAAGETTAASSTDMRDALILLRRREYAMRDLVSTHIAKGLASREKNRWGAARALAQGLDEADANMDDLIDARLTDDGWDPRSAWKAVASAVPSDDPWAPTPDISADVPEPVRRAITEQLVRALLDHDEINGGEWARRLTWALKGEGIDLTSAIEKRISDLTLGRDPSEPPF
ncbi:hypothetical protein RVR_8255 [Actinacidiphila reveromycinica]|uniref:Uncharacterized protein n=1 Tax=Actinacidiphila reveromycinica TaxID=659352 RepID=A0A7U3VRN2_9ACTN|nr:hypothetical protein [Streptomyces sp. SN-593]BBB01023.1 hypothetical protein RVR_8255 [Streptomyces sp. SN-593]